MARSIIEENNTNQTINTTQYYRKWKAESSCDVRYI
jgi:hypothetical protein